MKVLLSLLGTVVITSSSTAFATSNVFIGHKQEQDRLIQNNSDIDWKALEKQTTNYFNDLKNQQSLSSQQLFSNSSGSINTIEMINLAQEKALEYVEQFSNLNLSLEEMIDKISTEFPDFKKNYNETLINSSNNINNLYTNSLKEKSNHITAVTFGQNADGVKKIVENLKIAKYSLAVSIGAAAAAAAGFWAIAWLGGASVPWAVGCSTISALLGVGLAGVNIALVKYDSEISDLMKGYLSLTATIQLGWSMYNILAPALYTALSITAFSWAFPAVTATAAFITAFIIAVEIFKD